MRPAVAWDAIRQALRLHLPTAAIGALFASYGLAAYAHATALGMASQAAFDVLTTLHWAALTGLAIALGTHVATPSTVDPLLIARGAHPTQLWAQRLAGSTAVLCGVAALSLMMTLAAGWSPWSTSLWVGLGVFAQSLVVLCMAAFSRRLLAPTWTWFITGSLWWVAHMADETLALAAEGRAWAPWVYTVLPDLDRLNGAMWASADGQTIALSLASALLWCALFITGALWTLRR